jgi:hypothetical protein
VEQPLDFLSHPSTAGVARVLWLGDPRALPAGGWSVEPGLSYALTPQGLPDAAQVLTPAGPGPAVLVRDAVRQTISGGTVHLGQLLASAGVQYVVVVDGLAPSTVGTQPPSVNAPPPPGLIQDLLAQSDLQVVPGEVGVQVYRNSQFVPVTAQRGGTLPATRTWSYPGEAVVAGWQPALGPLAGGGPATGQVRPGTLYAGYAPAGSFALSQPGRSPVRRPAYGWAAQYETAEGDATLALSRFPYVPLGVALEVAVWVVLLAALLGPRRRASRRATVNA